MKAKDKNVVLQDPTPRFYLMRNLLNWIMKREEEGPSRKAHSAQPRNMPLATCGLRWLIILLNAYSLPSMATNICKHDPNHTMQGYIESGVDDLLRKNSAKNPEIWRDTNVIDMRRIPNDIEILPLPQLGVYRNIRPTGEFYLPDTETIREVIHSDIPVSHDSYMRMFSLGGIGCNITCKDEITPLCMVRTLEGAELLVFTYRRWSFFKSTKSHGKAMDDLRYTPMEDWEFIRDLSSKKSTGKTHK